MNNKIIPTKMKLKKRHKMKINKKNKLKLDNLLKKLIKRHSP